MELAMPWPVSVGEWLAWLSAVAAILLGFLTLAAPAVAGRFRGFRTQGSAAPAGGLRAGAGFPLGVGLCAILLAQPFIYLALGAAWVFSALARLVSLVADGGRSGAGIAWLVAETVLGLLPLAYVLGYVP